MGTPYKMAGMSFGNSPVKQEKLTKITDGDGKLIRKPKPPKPKAKKSGPKPVSNTKTDPRKRPYDDGRNKGTLKGKTGFEYDAIPVTNVLNKIGKVAKKGGKLLKKAYIDDNIKIAKNIKKYFTEK